MGRLRSFLVYSHSRIHSRTYIIYSSYSSIMPFFIATLLFLAQIVSGVIVPFDDWQHQRVALKDVSIHFRYHGTGPPLLLVHGYPQHSVRALDKIR